MNEFIAEVLRWLLVFSIYILVVGALFMALRALLNKLRGNALTAYRLWLIFPVGIALLASLQGIQPEVLAIPKILALEPLMFTTLTATPNINVNWQTAIFIVWLTVASALLTRLLVQYLYLKRKLLSNGTYLNENISKSDVASTPIAFGFFSPRIYIPGLFYELFTIKQQQLIIAHEQTHCDRYDPALRLTYKIINNIFWFHPVFYWLNQAMKNDQETSCDQLVIRNKGEALEYSKLLLAINQSVQSTTSELNLRTDTSELYCSSTSLLKERILMIKKLNPENKGHVRAWLGTAILSLAALGLMTTTAVLAVNESATKHQQSTPSEDIQPGPELRPIVRIHPKYPYSAVIDKVEGYVTMEFEVTTNGAVENVRVVASEPDSVFDVEAIRAMGKWRFVPIDHKFTARQTIEFKLSD